MFYQDHHLRDLFIFGSVALLAFAAMPARRANAGEIYLCADGRNLEVDNANREQILRTDPCALSWAALPKSQERVPQKASPQVVAAAQPQGAAAARVETASVMLVNAEELPAARTAGASAVKPAKTAATPSVPHARARKAASQRAHRSQRLAGVERGLAYMGDGIFAR